MPTNDDFDDLSSETILGLLQGARNREMTRAREEGVDILSALFTRNDQTTQEIVDGLEEIATEQKDQNL